MARTSRRAGLLPGRPHPLGARPHSGGVGFSVHSRHAEHVDLLLYEHADSERPRRTIALEPPAHRTWNYWHAFVDGIGPGQVYAYRVHGAFEPARGHRFDPTKVLLDPYGRAVAIPSDWQRSAGHGVGPNDAHACKSVVADDLGYDWRGDQPLRRPFAQTLIYEMHVRGFTQHESSGVPPSRRGTFAGVIDKIPYLLGLGVTAVELMPVFQYDPADAPPGHRNYWGYAPISFFAPHSGYASSAAGHGPLAVLDEFRDMVRALHQAGLEVILDVVFNHTAEGDERGPTFGLRGLDNSTYYLLDREGRYANHSGCGNTLNANHSVVRRLIMDSLHYWVRVMHVDGFRFDLASILSRDEYGHPVANPPVLWDIESDPVLAGTKLIAEAWDAAGLYQVGQFFGERWKEWNGKFRDDVRAFVRGDTGLVPRLADRLMGSPDLYGARPREPAQSINFVTSHDGFTLEDLVSYNHKHNEANGEDNRDGGNDEHSWNCGIEGPTDDAQVLALRKRQVKNLLAINLLSLGTPMLLMGDEMRRSQQGNNNAYGQDNELSWLDWTLLERHADIHRFVRGLVRIRNLRESVRKDHRLTLAELIARVNVQLHGVRLGEPDKAEHSRSLALTATSLSGDLLMHFALNAYWEALEFELPALPADARSGWRRMIDTARDAPHDVTDFAHAEGAIGRTHRVEPRSLVVMFAQLR